MDGDNENKKLTSSDVGHQHSGQTATTRRSSSSGTSTIERVIAWTETRSGSDNKNRIDQQEQPPPDKSVQHLPSFRNVQSVRSKSSQQKADKNNNNNNTAAADDESISSVSSGIGQFLKRTAEEMQHRKDSRSSSSSLLEKKRTTTSSAAVSPPPPTAELPPPKPHRNDNNNHNTTNGHVVHPSSSALIVGGEGGADASFTDTPCNSFTDLSAAVPSSHPEQIIVRGLSSCMKNKQKVARQLSSQRLEEETGHQPTAKTPAAEETTTMEKTPPPSSATSRTRKPPPPPPPVTPPKISWSEYWNQPFSAHYSDAEEIEIMDDEDANIGVEEAPFEVETITQQQQQQQQQQDDIESKKKKRRKCYSWAALIFLVFICAGMICYVGYAYIKGEPWFFESFVSSEPVVPPTLPPTNEMITATLFPSTEDTILETTTLMPSTTTNNNKTDNPSTASGLDVLTLLQEEVASLANTKTPTFAPVSRAPFMKQPLAPSPHATALMPSTNTPTFVPTVSKEDTITLQSSTTGDTDNPTFVPTVALALAPTLQSSDRFPTPQVRARNWLFRHPDFSEMESGRKEQLFALATFYYCMEGPNWPEAIQSKWLQYSNECQWFVNELGTFGDGESITYDVNPCTDNGRIQAIILEDLQLSSYEPFIPSELGLLTTLKVLELPASGINMPFADFLPSETLAQIENLEVLNLHSNNLFGPFGHLSLLSNLKKLDLHFNPLSSSLPSQLGLIKPLKTLTLYDSSLRGPIPGQLGHLLSLQSLTLHDNALTGPIPPEFDLLVPRAVKDTPGEQGSLRTLLLINNHLTGVVSSDICSMGLLNSRTGVGVYFDCNDQLCGCGWCDCGDRNGDKKRENAAASAKIWSR